LDSVKGAGLKDVCQMDSIRCSILNPETSLKSGPYQGASNYDDDMCQIDDKDDLFDDALLNSKSPFSSDDVKVCFFFLFFW